MADQTELIYIDAHEVKLLGDEVSVRAPTLASGSEARLLRPRLITVCVNGVSKYMIVIGGAPFSIPTP
jgi:hypothetical protein